VTTLEGRTPRPRADKERNRAHILEVAETFFSRQGVGGSLDAIAKRAGVGPGTLYRHFPTREALIAALLQARYDELFARFEAIREPEGNSGAALEEWLEALHAYVTAFDGLPDPLRVALSEESSPLAFTCHTVIAATEELLTAAQREGCARPWVRARDLFLSVLATAWVGDAALADEASGQAIRDILRAGWAVSPTERDASTAIRGSFSVYNALVVITHLLRSIDTDSGCRSRRLVALIGGFPSPPDLTIASLGMPAGWSSLDLWRIPPPDAGA